MNNVYNYCKICGKELSGRQKDFCSSLCKNKFYQSYESQIERGIKKRNSLVVKFGSKCSACGYKESPSTLVFIKNYKKVPLSLREIANHDLKFLEGKLHDSILVCKNCASEIENNDIPRNSNKPLNFDKFLANLCVLKLKSSDILVLGVSGGVDSVAMLHLFYEAEFKNIVVAHLNHGVRKEAKRDEDFVQQLALKYRYRFESKTIKKPTKGNLENELRKARREFLLETASKYRAKCVALAHNANDQAETIILNLTRGSGLTGLGGMKIDEGKIVRPLLNISRNEIEAYATLYNLKWVEDATNRDLKFSRNLVRHKVLPILKQINPEYLSNIQRTSHIAQEIDEYLENEVKGIVPSSCHPEELNREKRREDLDCHVTSNPRNDNSITALQKLESPLLFKFLSLNYEKLVGSRENLELKHLEMFKKLIKSTEGTKKIELPNGIIVKRSYGILEFLLKKEDNIASNKEKNLVLGENDFGEWLLTAQMADKVQFSKEKNVLYLDKKQFEKAYLRNWRAADKINKEGISGTKKLQDLFTDGKIDKDQRKAWPILAEEGNVLWIPRVAFSRDIKIKSKNIVKIIAEKGRK